MSRLRSRRRTLPLAALLVLLVSVAAVPAGATGGATPVAAPARGAVVEGPLVDRPGGVVTDRAGGAGGIGGVGPVGGASAAPGSGAEDGVAYSWPTGTEVPVVRRFDPPEAVWGAGHRGADLELAAGSRVRAAADGVVAFAGVVVDRPVVSIDHADGIRTTYEPVSPTVSAGDDVSAGDVIGHLRPGHCPPPDSCLHVGARTGPQSYVDPLRLFGADVVIRLFPS